MNITMIQVSDNDEDVDCCGDLLEDIDLEAVLVAAKEQSIDPSEYQLHIWESEIYFLLDIIKDGQKDNISSRALLYTVI